MASIEDPLISGTLENKKVYLIKCAVPKCPTRAISGFAKFPAEPSLRDIWFKLCGLSVLGKSARICHAHFKPSDFSTTTKKRHLLPSALPSLLLPDMSNQEENGLKVSKSQKQIRLFLFPLKNEQKSFSNSASASNAESQKYFCSCFGKNEKKRICF